LSDRDRFSELSVVFMDTTSLLFTGAGGETLGERGYSNDHRPDLMQRIVGVVIDAAGRPVCSQMWPGNTADGSVLVPVIDRLRSRFAIGRVCVVADQGMICAPTIAALEQRGLEYVLGARERTDSLIRTVVLADTRPFTPLCVQRVGSAAARRACGLSGATYWATSTACSTSPSKAPARHGPCAHRPMAVPQPSCTLSDTWRSAVFRAVPGCTESAAVILG
jgi:hypothetical protein